MSDPLVTIVIPCFNAAAFVADAIDSALAQSYSPVEVVVIDDGSTDQSLEVLRGYADRIRWETGPNRGGSAARNRGVEIAQGEMIQFLDSDDLLHPGKLERQVALLRRSEADVVYCNIEVIDLETAQRLDVYRPLEATSFGRCCMDIIQTSAPLHWTKNLTLVGGFDESLPCSQERDLHVRMACHGLVFEPLPEILATVRKRADSVSSNYERVMQVRRGIVTRAAELLAARGENDDRRLRLLAGMLARDGRAWLQMGRRDEAARSFEIARRLHPAGGIDVAYSSSTRMIRRLIGPALTESLVNIRRRWSASPAL